MIRALHHSASTIALCLSLSLTLSACGGGGGSASAQTPPVTPPTTPPPTNPPVDASGCVAGDYKVVSGTPEEAAVRYETAHYAFRWKGDAVNMNDAVAAGQKLEQIWTAYMGPIKFPTPYCDTATKGKANINLDPSFALSGGPTGDRDMGMWIHPLSLKDNWGLAHEFAHGLQGSTRGLRDSPYVGWLWESHANWITHQLPEFRSNVHCSEMLVNFPHLYYGSTRDRYCNWQFLEYLKNEHGYEAVNNIWTGAIDTGQPGYLEEDVFAILMRNQKWTIDELNTVFGNWALSNVNWDYINPDGSDQGAVYRNSYGSYDSRDGQRALRVTQLDPIDLAGGRFAVPELWAPQRWGYNLVRLYPDAGATRVTVTFRGVVQDKPASALPGLNNEPATVADPNSDWRWGVVAIGADGTSRISPAVDGADGDMIFPVKADDKALYMVVVGTPKVHQKIAWDQAYYSLYRYPWMVQLEGAKPEGFQASAANPTASGHRHANGGGVVANAANVASSAYVGPYARVLGGKVSGNARIEDHAIVTGGDISGNAVVGGMSVISKNVVVKDNAVVKTTFMGIGEFEPGTELSGTAQIYGDAEVRGGPKLSKGVYTGMVDQASQNDPKQGSELTAIPAGVTAKPNYVWRP